jgi:hypothetical protein
LKKLKNVSGEPSDQVKIRVDWSVIFFDWNMN